MDCIHPTSTDARHCGCCWQSFTVTLNHLLFQDEEVKVWIYVILSFQILLIMTFKARVYKPGELASELLRFESGTSSSVELSRKHAGQEWNCCNSLVNLRWTTQPACGRGLTCLHTDNCEDVFHVRAMIRSWFANLLHTENCRWGRDSRTVLKVAMCHSLRAEELIHVQ